MKPSRATGGNPSAKRKNARKKALLLRAVLAVAAVFAVLLVILGVLATARGCVRRTPKADRQPAVQAAPDLAPSDAYENIFDDPDYTRLDRAVHYTVENENGSYAYVLDEHDRQSLTEGGRFFLRYFDAVIRGDEDIYRTFFSDVYRENEAGFKNFEDRYDTRTFPMQRVYDIYVTELLRTEKDDPNYTYRGETVVYSVYEVSYKILKNGGDFRVDLRSGGTVPLIFELMTVNAGTDDEVTFINGMYRYADIPADE